MQKVKIIKGANESDLLNKVRDWLQDTTPTPVPNVTIPDLEGLRVMFIYTEQTIS
jgi:hypothetical protein